MARRRRVVCTCDRCPRPISAADRAAVAIGVLAVALIPGRLFLHLILGALS